jgi:hypothetical protein
MTPHRITNTAIGLLILIGASAILLGGPVLDDHADEWQQSSTLADAQRAARAERQRELNAIRQCTALHGPGAAVGFTIDGDVACGPRRGHGAVVLAAQGGAR